MRDNRFYNTVMRFAEKHDIDMMVKCPECGHDFLPVAIEQIDDVAGINLECENCDAVSGVYVSIEDHQGKDNG